MVYCRVEVSKMTETKRKRSAGRRILTAALIALCVVLLLLLGVRGYFRLSVRNYYRHAEKTFVIPGLSDGMIVQGLAYEEEKGDFFVTGYRADGAASQVSLVHRADGKEQKRLSLADQSGSAYLGHVGGITVANDFVYVADEAGLMVYSLSDFYAAADGGTVTAVGFFPTKTADDSLAVAFVHNDGENIYVGEFFREQNYPTPDSHKYTTAAGDESPALLLSFRLDKDAPCGIAPTVEKAYSIPGLVQGMCIDDGGNICLSTPYAAAFSHLYVYGTPQTEGEVTVLGQTLPRYVLDSSCLKADIKAPPMAEEIVTVDGKLYTMCESATDKYIFGKFTSAKYCYAADLAAWL